MLVAAVLTAGVVAAPTTPAGANESFTFTRLAGTDRYETASIVAKAFAASSDNAVVATGETFPDALAGNYLAGSLTAPIVLTTRDALPAPSATALSDLKVANVTLLGGPAAVSDTVEADLEGKDYKVERIAGTDRYETARLVAEKPGAEAVGSESGKKTAIVASGENFPDAIAAGPLSFASKFPTLLTTPGQLSPAARAGLTSLGIQQVLLLGGSAAIAPAVEAELTAAGMSVVRLAGADRTETATKIADYAVSKLGFTNTRVTLTRGTAFPDALAGGPNGGKQKTPTLLTESPSALGAATTAWLEANAATLTEGDILGGVNAISQETQTAAETAAGRNADVPTVTITEGPSNDANAPSDKPTYKGTAADDVAVDKVEAKIDTGEFATTGVTCTGCSTPNATWTFKPGTALATGTHTIVFRAVNTRGATSAELTRTVNIDPASINRPGITINDDTSTLSPTNDTTPSFRGAVTDVEAGLTVRARYYAVGATTPPAFSATYMSCTGCTGTAGSWSYDLGAPLSGGTYKFEFEVTDSDGNTNTATRDLTIDTVAPLFDGGLTAQVLSTTVTAKFSEPLKCSTVAAEDFTATVDDGAATTVVAAGCNASDEKQVDLTISVPPTDTTKEVVVTLVGSVTDPAGNVATSGPGVTQKTLPT